MEGLEHAVENFFGPSGYFPQKNIAKMLREKRSISNNKIKDLDDKVRQWLYHKIILNYSSMHAAKVIGREKNYCMLFG